MDIRETLKKLLEQVKEAEKLADSNDTQSDRFVRFLLAISQTATIGREMCRMGKEPTFYEGCFVGILADLKCSYNV
jgi:hypothetical protein